MFTVTANPTDARLKARTLTGHIVYDAANHYLQVKREGQTVGTIRLCITDTVFIDTPSGQTLTATGTAIGRDGLKALKPFTGHTWLADAELEAAIA